MSRDLGRDIPGSEKLYARKLWVDFSFAKFFNNFVDKLVLFLENLVLSPRFFFLFQGC